MSKLFNILIKYKRIPYKVKSHMFSTISMVGNFFVALVKTIVALFIGSAFIGLGGFATFSLGLAKFYYFKNKDKEQSTKGVRVILFMFSLFYITYMIFQIVYIHESIVLSVIPAITIAMVSFLEIGFALYGLIKSIRIEEKYLSVLKSINLCSAFTAIVLTQSILLSLQEDPIDHYLYDAILGLIVGVICIMISLIMVRKPQFKN